MHDSLTSDSVLTSRSVEEFFRDALQVALEDQHVEASPPTVDYVVNLLTIFARSDRLYEHTGEGVGVQPLAMIYADAVYSTDPVKRIEALRRLGDVALFISGLFHHSLNRKLVDVEYYMAMGGSAYSALSSSRASDRHVGISRNVFQELSQKFGSFVDALSELSKDASFNNDSDLLRTYELWQRTGSRRAANLLRKAGIALTGQTTTGTRH